MKERQGEKQCVLAVWTSLELVGHLSCTALLHSNLHFNWNALFDLISCVCNNNNTK